MSPQTIFKDAKHLGSKNKRIGNNELKIIEQNIIPNHSATNNLELLIQSFFLSSGIHSFITLVSKPKACQIISLCRDL